jgi:hypothetical protein
VRAANRPRLLAAFAVALLLTGGAVAYFVTQGESGSTPAGDAEPPESLDIPKYTETAYRNVTDATYIGTAACAACHAGNHASYKKTAHSASLADLKPADEPPDGSFHHAASGRTYSVYRHDGQLRQREVLRNEADKVVASVDLPVRYLIGSGHYCRSYLVEVDGFVHESPITWYTAKQKWDMSPGYDAPRHWSFERPARVGCLACHAGQVAVGDTVHKAALPEKAIGCESCHGPGSLHQAKYRMKPDAIDPNDDTIVNPGKLSRELGEAICARCHLSGSVTVNVRGRTDPTAYRPGRPLTDYRVDYRFEPIGDGMTVVGHVQQMRLSKCYQQSESLTCITCHDPHNKVDAAKGVAFYRQKCLECHTRKGCSVPEPERRTKQPADNCAACHMPTADTDIPHIAFTHHRIGKHAPGSRNVVPPKPTSAPDLVPIDESPALTKLDKRRNLGLAYALAADVPENATYAEAFVSRAREHLEAVQARGLPDAEVDAHLAKICWISRDVPGAEQHARAALADKKLAPNDRVIALAVLANVEVENRNPKAALALYEELVKLRRFADDWRSLGICYLNLEQPEYAASAFQRALEIRPFRPGIHEMMAEAQRRLGNRQAADDRLGLARWLVRKQQD